MRRQDRRSALLHCSQRRTDPLHYNAAWTISAADRYCRSVDLDLASDARANVLVPGDAGQLGGKGMAVTAPLLEVIDLKTFFDGELGEVRAVDGVSFELAKGASIQKRPLCF